RLVLRARLADLESVDEPETGHRDSDRRDERREGDQAAVDRRRVEDVAVLGIMRVHRSEAGFSLPELLVATALLLIISGAVTSALMQMTNSQKTIWNRTEMHAGVRSATELLQQEVGQAGRVAVPSSIQLADAVLVPGVSTVGI